MPDFIKKLLIEMYEKLQASLRVERGALVLQIEELQKAIAELDKLDSEVEELKKKVDGGIPLDAAKIIITSQQV